MTSCEFLPAIAAPRQDLVLLHGWGSGIDVWRPLLARLRPWANVSLIDYSDLMIDAGQDSAALLAQLLEEILARAPSRAVYIGWSLGGQLAAELAGRAPDRVTALVTVCSNPAFIAAGDWPGMDAGEFADFQALVADHPQRGIKRFNSLQAAGSVQSRGLLRDLQVLSPAWDRQSLIHGLDWLAQLDQRALLRGLPQPRLHLFAEQDSLVPAAVKSALISGADSAGLVRTVMLPGSSHVAPRDIPDALAEEIAVFLADSKLLWPCETETEIVAKADVAQSFSGAAAHYDSVAALQRDVGSRLSAYLDHLPQEPDTVLDLGCGTGYFLADLRARFPQVSYVGLDLAEGMVNFARETHAGEGVWLVGDAEALPLAPSSVDLVFSSLAIQWCYRPDLLFAELARVLRPGGVCVFSSLGPDTLRELRSSWAAVDDHQHVNDFLHRSDLAAAADGVPGLVLELHSEMFCMEYLRVRDLLSELKTLGAHNMNRDRPSGLTGRRSLQGMLQAYEGWRRNGLLPATYDVIFGVVTKL